jgi:cytochrome P450
VRSYPAVPNLARGSLDETALPYCGGSDGSIPICVIAGDTASWNIFTMHRDPAVFGADVESYHPDRREGIHPGWSYLLFGGGARRCPAQQPTLFWVSYTVVRLALEFEEVRNEDLVEEYMSVENPRTRDFCG